MDGSAWTFIGPMQGLPDHWSIDATVFSYADSLYCCYSGWPLNDNSDTQQDLFLVKLSSPEAAIRDTLVCISRAELPWERCDNNRRGINEGPTWVDTPGFRGIVYSANGSWTNDYKLGLLALVGNDPLQASSWQKRPAPLLTSDVKRGRPFGPGHASFINSPYHDGKIYCIYHGTERPDEGWNNRKARVLCMGPEHFHPQAPTVCCATVSPMPGAGAGGGIHGQPGFPGSTGRQQYQPQPADTRHHGFMDKLGDKLKGKLREL